MIKFFFLLLILVSGWFFFFQETGQTLWQNWFVESRIEEQRQDLLSKKETLEKKMEQLSQELEGKKEEGLQRAKEIEETLAETKQSYEDIINSLHRFQRALDLSKPLSDQKQEE